MTKPTKWLCTQRRLGSAWASAQSDQSSLCVAKDPSFLHVNSEDSDQTGRMARLIWAFAGRTVILLVLSWGGSYYRIFFSKWLIHINKPFLAYPMEISLWLTGARKFVGWGSERWMLWYFDIIFKHFYISFVPWHDLSHIMRKPVNAICEQQRRRSACASVQSDQCLCCSLPG